MPPKRSDKLPHYIRIAQRQSDTPLMSQFPLLSLLPVDTEIPIIAPQSPSPPPAQRSLHNGHHHHSSSAGASVAGLLGSVNNSQIHHGPLHHRQLLHGLLSGAHLNGNGTGPYQRNYSTSSTGQLHFRADSSPSLTHSAQITGITGKDERTGGRRRGGGRAKPVRGDRRVLRDPPLLSAGTVDDPFRSVLSHRII